MFESGVYLFVGGNKLFWSSVSPDLGFSKCFSYKKIIHFIQIFKCVCIDLSKVVL